MKSTTNPEAKEATMLGFTYEIRVDHSDGSDVAKIDAATLTEALQRAARIWSGVTNTTLLCTVDRQPQKFLAW